MFFLLIIEDSVKGRKTFLFTLLQKITKINQLKLKENSEKTNRLMKTIDNSDSLVCVFKLN